ncbi:MAG: hypothetical protein ACREQ3_09345 [Candidatus Binatia bacterium]
MSDNTSYVVRTFDNSAWHSNGVTGDTVFRNRGDAEKYLAVTKSKQSPGQSALIIKQ